MSPFIRKVLIGLGSFVVVGGGVSAWISHGNPSTRPVSLFEGVKPKLVDPQPERFPSIALAKTIGWAPNAAPLAAQGLAVTRFAEGLSHPRTMLTLPNGDVLVAETDAPPGNDPGGVTGLFQRTMIRFVGAGQPSPNKIVLLRDTGNGKAGAPIVLRSEGRLSPSGMAWHDGKLYIANHDAVLAFDYPLGATSISGNPSKIMDLPASGNHWMRNLLLSPDASKLYVAIGSSSNIAERGLKAEQGRAAIYEITLATGHARQFAAGLRNPNGMGWNPASGELWTVVNERDMLGPDLVPDYLTNVPVGVHYGWPWVYWKNIIDERVNWPMPEYLTDYTRKPEYALGPHTAPLGLAFVTGGQRLGPNFANGAFIARHGSWNRKPASGYDVVFVQFDTHGNPLGKPVPVLTGFLDGKGHTHGRPTWLAWSKEGALLVSDDTAGIIWRVIAPGAGPAPAIQPVQASHLKPQRDLNSDPEAQYKASFGPEGRVKQ